MLGWAPNRGLEDHGSRPATDKPREDLERYAGEEAVHATVREVLEQAAAAGDCARD